MLYSLIKATVVYEKVLPWPKGLCEDPLHKADYPNTHYRTEITNIF